MYIVSKGVVHVAISYLKLRMKLVEKGKKLQDLYDDVGISRGTIAKIEKDDYMNISTIEKIATYLECDIGDLVSIKK